MRLLAAGLALLPVATAAQRLPPAAIVQVDPAMQEKADALVAFLGGQGRYDALFDPGFRAAISAEQFGGVVRSLGTALGRPLRVDTLAVPVRWRAQATIAFERGTATVQFAVDPAEPHQITELRVTDQAPSGDALARIEADLRALPGTTAMGVYALGTGAPVPLIELRGEQAMPLGSAFKLWVLAEAARQVAAGTRHWRDVVAVGPASLPSGVLQAWPAKSPVTVQTLATLMISISDNTATDTLMRTLGRAAVDRGAVAAGLSTPVLTTREAFVMKGDAALRARWTGLQPPERAALLARDAPRFDVTPLATGMFAGGPVATDTVEWFATPRATAALLDRLRLTGGDTARAILSVNPAADRATADRFAYLGYKGGSEPGVLSLNFLARTRAGGWYAVAIAWHRPDGEVAEAPLALLASRVLRLLAER